MTDPSQLLASPYHPELVIGEVLASAGGRFGDLYRRIWEPIGGGGRSAWTEQRWIDELSPPNVRAWIAQTDGCDVAMAETGWSGTGDAGFVVIGVTPECQGQGFGGDLLSRLTQLLWDTPAPNRTSTTRVWIWTVPDEHPATVPNYLARGFQYADE